MQQMPPQQQSQAQAEYASLGLRFAAVVIDTVIVYFAASLVWAAVLVTRLSVDPQDPGAMEAIIEEVQASTGTFYLVFFCGLFIYYLLLEAIFNASVGKMLLGMRVVMIDGSRATGVAVVLRNLVRVPEALLLYVPAGISCLSSDRRQRLGDRAARTMVVRRRRATVVYGAPAQPPPFGQPAAPPAGPAAPPSPVSPGAWPTASPAGPAQPPAAEPAALETQLGRLKTAALAARGAHLSYLRFSERELAAGSDEQAGGYSEGYVSAWFTLTDAVAALKDAKAGLESAASAAGQTPADAVAAQPDLGHLLDELAPYFQATGDDAVHAAFLQVARAEPRPS
jgi:uncharacterized RDD family membrane protein YckC